MPPFFVAVFTLRKMGVISTDGEFGAPSARRFWESVYIGGSQE